MNYNVYKIDSKMYYNGYSLVAAESVEEANALIDDFKEKDKDNHNDSYGYSYVEDLDVIENVFATTKGILIYGINYVGYNIWHKLCRL